MTTTTPTAPNGIDVTGLADARTAMAGQPSAARFAYRATSTWQQGLHVRHTIADFAGAGADHAHRVTHVLDTDSPELFGATDAGPGPTETALAALGGCLVAVTVLAATGRGITVRSVTASVEGDLDMRGSLGLDPTVRNGFEAVRVAIDVDADADRDVLEAVVAEGAAMSPVLDLFTAPTPVAVALA